MTAMKLHALAVFSLFASSVTAGTPASSSEDLSKLCAPALQGDTESIAALRSNGQRGLDALLSHEAKLVSDLREGRVAMDDDKALALRRAADAVARQRDAHSAGLFWFTDLEAAKVEAKKTGKQILSLRLLGNLDEEFSCANSRFFRTVLYANADVSRTLREHYVLHWKSVRPVPRITIDMGDGRRIQRTITGNSIHYVLDRDGLVLDALPGLYGPKAFLTTLRIAEASTSWRQGWWHGTEADRLCLFWLEDAIKAGVYGPLKKSEYEGGRMEGQVALLSSMKVVAFPTSKRSSDNTGDLFDVARVLRQRISKVPPGRLGPVDAIYPTEFSPSKGMVERPILKQTAQQQAVVQPPPNAASASKTAEYDGGIILPQVKFEGATLDEAVDFIRIKSKDVAQSKDLKWGINVIVREGNKPNRTPISMDLRDVPAHEALRYAAEIAGMKFSIENGIVIIAPLSGRAKAAVKPGDIDDLLKQSAPSALTAANRADAKSMVERPILKKITEEDSHITPLAHASDPFASRLPLFDLPLAEKMTPPLWNAIAALHLDEVRLDLASRRFMMSKLPADSISADERASGCVSDNRTPFARTLARFEMSVAEDTVKNEYLFHTQIHQWLEEDKDGTLTRDVEALNKRVYAELFLTPDYDVWLGLVPEDTYTALEKDGCACDKGALPMRR